MAVELDQARRLPSIEIQQEFACGCVNTWLVHRVPPDEPLVFISDQNCRIDVCDTCRGGVQRCPHRQAGLTFAAAAASLESLDRDVPRSKRPRRRTLFEDYEAPQ